MNWVHLSFFTLSFLILCIKAQQEYSGNSIFSCNNSDETKPSLAFLYTAMGNIPLAKPFCCSSLGLLMIQFPVRISTLTSSDPTELARFNNVTGISVFPVGKEVIVPVNCSCSGQYYQANTTFTIEAVHETYLIAANDTYQGLATCDSLKRANPYSEFVLYPGLQLQVPPRCACPTKKQAANGTRYLLTRLTEMIILCILVRDLMQVGKAYLMQMGF